MPPLFNSQEKVVVLGSNGFIGSALLKQLLQQEVNAIGLNRSNGGEIHLDNMANVLETIADCTTIINASGSLKPKHFEQNLTRPITDAYNLLSGLEKIVEHSKAKRILHISSAGTVYGEAPAGEKQMENTQPKPTTWYGSIKAIEEIVLLDAAKRSNKSISVARLSNPYGKEHIDAHGLVDALAHGAAGHRSVSVCVSPLCQRDFIHIDDATRSILRLAASPHNGIFNIGSGHSTSLLELTHTVMTKYPDAAISLDKKTEAAHSDVMNSQISIDKYLKCFPNEYTKFSDPLQYIEEFVSVKRSQ